MDLKVKIFNEKIIKWFPTRKQETSWSIKPNPDIKYPLKVNKYTNEYNNNL